MKKYTDEHLESVDPCWINAVEKMIEDGPLDGDIPGEYGCPPKQYGIMFQKISGFLSSYLACNTCIINFGYTGIKCPCIHFKGCKKAIKEAQNLISQWKQWAGVEECIT